MKKFTKICLIIAVICLILGVGITAMAGVNGARIRDLPHINLANDWGFYAAHWLDNDDWYDDDWNPDNWSDDAASGIQEAIENAADELTEYWKDPFQTIKTQSFQNVKKLDLEANGCGVQFISFKPAAEEEKNQIQIKVGEGNGSYKMYMEGDELKIKSSFNGDYDRGLFTNGRLSFDWKNESRRIQVFIPEGYQFDEVEISGKAALVDVDQLHAEKLDADMSAGILKIYNGNVDNLEGDLKVGDFLYEGDINRKADIDCKIGSVQLALNGKKTDYNYWLRASLGSVYLEKDEYTGLKKRDIQNMDADKSLDLDCKLGEIMVTFKEQ